MKAKLKLHIKGGNFMKIISENPLLLDEIYNDLNRKDIQSQKATKKIEGAMGDVTTYIALVALSVQSIDTLINYLSYRQSQKKNYLHFKYKDGIEVKLENLSQDELNDKKEKLREDIKNDTLEFIYIG